MGKSRRRRRSPGGPQGEQYGAVVIVLALFILAGGFSLIEIATFMMNETEEVTAYTFER